MMAATRLGVLLAASSTYCVYPHARQVMGDGRVALSKGRVHLLSWLKGSNKGYDHHADNLPLQQRHFVLQQQEEGEDEEATTKDEADNNSDNDQNSDKDSGDEDGNETDEPGETNHEGTTEDDASQSDSIGSDESDSSPQTSWPGKLFPEQTNTRSSSAKPLNSIMKGVMIGGVALLVLIYMFYRKSSSFRQQVDGVKWSWIYGGLDDKSTSGTAASANTQRKPRYPTMKSGPRPAYPAGIVNESDYSDSDCESPSRPQRFEGGVGEPALPTGQENIVANPGGNVQDGGVNRSRSNSRTGENQSSVKNHRSRITGRLAVDGYVSLRDETPHISGDSSPPGMRDFRSLKAWM
eukprot:gb/GEZN01009567.1/.p1 GENE.gb/GEZN01009567.1/~~gb/GEZN01009567.1/.p1  ORF type:complete len:351 (+),score=38.65 gb/GEZN01009567.1/:90-1142(+)